MKAIEIIQKSIKTHKDWAEFFEANPEQESLVCYKNIGDAKFHRQCIKEYEKAIDEINQLIERKS